MKDATSRASKMPRGSGLLYPNPHLHQQGDDPPEYIGVIRLQNGEFYWVLARNRIVNGKCAIEINLETKNQISHMPSKSF